MANTPLNVGDDNNNDRQDSNDVEPFW